MLRQPIITIMGHVDHGKTSLLDAIRGSAIASREAGGITQAIGASILPMSTLQAVCGELLQKMNLKLSFPGLLFIDTPGHAAFVHHRKVGGDLADIAVLVIDVHEGIMPQTVECLNILRSCKTPFIIAANKIDSIEGWRPRSQQLIASMTSQEPDVVQRFDTKVYDLVAKLYDHKFEAERFDRVSDYARQIAIVPVSAKTREGIPELLMVLCGLTQKFLEKNIQCDPTGLATGTVLEVKEEKGVGSVLDVILFDGVIRTNDTIVVAGPDGPIVSKVKVLLEPEPLQEMRKSKFRPVKEVCAASGLRVGGSGLENVIPGTPLFTAAPDTLEEKKCAVQKELQVVTEQLDKDGVIVKADTLGSLEALRILLREKKIPVVRASIGMITKKDVSDAEASKGKNPLHGVVLGFNIPPITSESVKVIVHNVIYQVIEEYEKWVEEQTRVVESGELASLPKPCKIQLLTGYVFRQSNPAIVGVEVQLGTLKTGTSLMKVNGEPMTGVKAIEKEQKTVSELLRNDRAAVSFPGLVLGRNVKEGEILYTVISEDQFRKFKDFKQLLKEDEKQVLKEIADIMRKANPVWGI
ncbi:translation initiation factor IF-2 [Candidatus Woesearchaeota archaeon]|nr:translation initiation factor IF-2 [Candidatus Woesearchaeota archaeon]